MKYKMFDHKIGGFTLIELMVVVSIIGMLSSMTLAALQAARIRAINSKFSVEARSLQKALLLWKNNHNETLIYCYWPCSDNPNFGEQLITVLAPLVTGKYISKIPRYPNTSDYSRWAFINYIPNQSEYAQSYSCDKVTSYQGQVFPIGVLYVQSNQVLDLPRGISTCDVGSPNSCSYSTQLSSDPTIKEYCLKLDYGL